MEGFQTGKNQPKGDKRQVDHDQLHPFVVVTWLQIADVKAFPQLDARVLPQFPIQQASTDVESEDLLSAVLQ